MKRVIGIVVALLLLPAIAQAEKGDRSAGLFASITKSDSYDWMIISADYGQFISENIELNASVAWMDSDPGSAAISIDGRADYFLPFQGASTGKSGLGPVEPFIGAGAGATFGDGYDYFELLGEGGVRIPVSASADLEAKAQVVVPLDSDADVLLTLLSGIRVNF